MTNKEEVINTVLSEQMVTNVKGKCLAKLSLLVNRYKVRPTKCFVPAAVRGYY